MRYLDASIPVGLMIGQPKQKLEDIRAIMEAVEAGRERVATSVFTIAEIVYVLEREGKDGMFIAEVIDDFLGCGGLKVIDAKADDALDTAMEIYKKYKIDFVDAHHIATMQEMRIREIYSLDPHYDCIPKIKRLEQVAAKVR
ncbi:MAG: hypothetical protein MSIBF_01365 [Candidatus Altiarchaeales archaeon IMC4]|nr:MAG: hypothetical protein MSIBF_01365 [Candidatus Altiarchaeales archaeon IMC4]